MSIGKNFIIATDHDGKMPRLLRINERRCIGPRDCYTVYQNDRPVEIKPYPRQTKVYDYDKQEYVPIEGTIKKEKIMSKALASVKSNTTKRLEQAMNTDELEQLVRKLFLPLVKKAFPSAFFSTEIDEESGGSYGTSGSAYLLLKPAKPNEFDGNISISPFLLYNVYRIARKKPMLRIGAGYNTKRKCCYLEFQMSDEDQSQRIY